MTEIENLEYEKIAKEYIRNGGTMFRVHKISHYRDTFKGTLEIETNNGLTYYADKKTRRLYRHFTCGDESSVSETWVINYIIAELMHYLYSEREYLAWASTQVKDIILSYEK